MCDLYPGSKRRPWLRTRHSPLNDITTYGSAQTDDLKAFYDEILNGGAMPLDLTQERVEAWIKNQAAQNRQAKS